MKRWQVALMVVLVLAVGIGIGTTGPTLSSFLGRVSIVVATSTPQPAPTSSPTDTPTAAPTRTVSQLLKAVGPSIVRISTQEGEGTGFVAFQDGQILTAFHVVGNTTIRPTIIAADGSEFQAAVYSADEEKDIALLLAPRINAPPLPLAPEVSVGEQVTAIGYAAGLPGEPSVTRGIISGKRVFPESDVEYLQTDAPINPGNSGGPLLNERGEVVGMNVARLRGSRAQYENLGFAISIEEIARRRDALRGGEVKLLPTFTPIPRPTSTPRPVVAPAMPTPTPYVTREYSEKRPDGRVYIVQQWSDGRFSEQPAATVPTRTPTPGRPYDVAAARNATLVLAQRAQDAANAAFRLSEVVKFWANHRNLSLVDLEYNRFVVAMDQYGYSIDTFNIALANSPYLSLPAYSQLTAATNRVGSRSTSLGPNFFGGGYADMMFRYGQELSEVAKAADNLANYIR